MKSFYLFKLKDINLNDVIKKVEEVSVSEPPKKISMNTDPETVISGFFDFTKHRDGCTLNHYFRRNKVSIDPYTKESFNQSELKITNYSFVQNGKDIMIFLSGDSDANIFKKMSIDSDSLEKVGYDLDYIRFLNESNEKTSCYKEVISNHDLYSLGRYGGNDTGHRIKEDYFDINDRDKETKTALHFVTYAKISVATSSAELTIILYAVGKLTAVNFSGDYFEFTRELVKVLNIIDSSYNDFIKCKRGVQ